MFHGMTIRTVVVLTVLVSLASCADHSTALGPTHTVWLSGHVTDGARPLLGAEVHVASTAIKMSVWTDVDGAYEVEVGRGDVTVRVGKDGFTGEVRQLTLTGNEQVDFVLQRPGPVADVMGVYTLTFTASPSCGFPPEAMHRTYTARIQEGRDLGRREDLVVRLSGADFVTGGTEAGFTGWRAGTEIYFRITDSLLENHVLIERLPSGQDLYYLGDGIGEASGGTIRGWWEGRMRLGGAACQAGDHGLEFVR